MARRLRFTGSMVLVEWFGRRWIHCAAVCGLYCAVACVGDEPDSRGAELPCDSCDERNPNDIWEPNNTEITATEIGAFEFASAHLGTLPGGDADWLEAVVIPRDDLPDYEVVVESHESIAGAEVCLFFGEDGETSYLLAERVGCRAGRARLDEESGLVGCCNADWKPADGEWSRLRATGMYFGDRDLDALYVRLQRPGEADELGSSYLVQFAVHGGEHGAE